MKTWKTLARRVLLDRSPFLLVEEHTVETPKGVVIGDWTWVDTPDYAIIVAIDAEGCYLALNETHYGTEGEAFSPPGGHIDPGEEPLTTAKRELLEETGYEAEEWQFLGSFRTDLNRGNGVGWYYLARGARKVRAADENDLEEHKLVLLSRERLEEMLRTNQMKEITSQAAFLMALAHQG
ncbi:MAG TPA: NUDIX hydrolase [Anaerolineaceae bacterium]|nr:NUDIX hydrolase [Anaerolineaceae bacterium]